MNFKSLRNQPAICLDQAEILTMWILFEILSTIGFFSSLPQTIDVKSSRNQLSTLSDQAKILTAWLFLEILTISGIITSFLQIVT